MSDENPWQILDSKHIYENPWIRLVEHQVINPNGGKGIYGEVHFKNIAIGIIPISDDGYTWLVGQYRFPLKSYSWEIPEGGGALSQNPLESAHRELNEETGIRAKQLIEIQRLHLSNSVSDELAIIYIAKDLEMGIAMPEETEQLQIKKLKFLEAYQMVINGEITDSMSVAGILKAKILLDQGKI